MMERMLDAFDCDAPHRMMALFSSIFIQQNRMQTACEKVQTDITMKQWLLLAMLEQCPEPRTLTNVGRLMGCSRQNVKQLARSLERKGYLTITEGPGHSLRLTPTGKTGADEAETDARRGRVLQLLFADFSQAELAQFYALHRKLYAGITRVEDYAQEVDRP